MPVNTNVDTTDLERVAPPALKVLPPLDSPSKSPFYVSQLPGASAVGADVVANFRNNGIPSYRISPPVPLTLAGATSNATPTPTISSFNILQPPAPTISQTLTSIPTGYQFSFSEVRLPLDSSIAINAYRVYRNTTSDVSTAVGIQTFQHNAATLSKPIVVQDAQPNGATQFYWVSSISTAGLESSLTPAQGVTVVNNAALNSNSQLASSFHNNPVNTSYAAFDSVTLSNNTATVTITVTANTNQFAPGQVHYNSGTVSPPSFGTWVIFADDPTFAGGAPIYSFSSNIQTLAAAEGRILLGKITTSNTTASSGGGFTGGTTGPTAIGGRGLIQL